VGVGEGPGAGAGAGDGAGTETESAPIALTWFDICERRTRLIAALPATIVRPRAPMISAYSDAELPSSLRMKRPTR
jgi:hypothetical protein